MLAVLSLGGTLAHAGEHPKGITVQLTDSGAVYADAAGRTLYFSQIDDTPGKAKCTAEQFHKGTAQLRNIQYPLMRPDARPTCLDKLVPVQPASDAAPTGPWAILERPDGVRQWMYERRPVYTSIKDDAPGQVNGSYGYFFAPRPVHVPVAMPSGLIVVRPDGGGAYFATATNTRPVIAAPRGSRPPSALDWTPLAAPDLAAPFGKWGVAAANDGAPRWTYDGEDLYLYAGFDPVPDALPRGWHILNLAPRAPLPSAFRTQRTIPGRMSSSRVVTTSAGKTVYTFSCQEEGPDRLGCDDPADASPAWTTICGGVQRCADLFRPVVATPGARPDGTVWSITTISAPWSPVRAVDGQSGIKVWAFRGRPLFTYAKDQRAGDTEGELSAIWKQWKALDAGEY